MSSISKGIQIILIIILIFVIVAYNKDLFTYKTLDKIFNYFGYEKINKNSEPPTKHVQKTEETASDLFHTEYAPTEDMDEAFSDALKSVV